MARPNLIPSPTASLWDESRAPSLSGDPTEEEWEAHDHFLLVKHSPALLGEVDLVLGSSDILTEGEKEFFHSMKRLCEASIATGNSIVF